jgi:hypothetical protein
MYVVSKLMYKKLKIGWLNSEILYLGTTQRYRVVTQRRFSLTFLSPRTKQDPMRSLKSARLTNNVPLIWKVREIIFF